MFYTTDKNDHGLKPNPLKACIIPRPIAWITSCSPDGVVNVAPFSYFNAIADHPPMVMFASSAKAEGGVMKDTVRNITETGEFVVNLVTYVAKDAMNITSTPLPYGESELTLAGLDALPSTLVVPPRLAISPVHLECTHWQTVTLPATNPLFSNQLIMGKVIGVHIDDAVIVEGKVDPEKLDVIARIGYGEYARLGQFFTLNRPYR